MMTCYSTCLNALVLFPRIMKNHQKKTLRIESESLVYSIVVEVLCDLTLKLILPVKLLKFDGLSL